MYKPSASPKALPIRIPLALSAASMRTKAWEVEKKSVIVRVVLCMLFEDGVLGDKCLIHALL